MYCKSCKQVTQITYNDHLEAFEVDCPFCIVEKVELEDHYDDFPNRLFRWSVYPGF